MKPIAVDRDPMKAAAQLGGVATSDILKYARYGQVPLPGEDLWGSWKVPTNKQQTREMDWG
jgi:hypothetical protein